MCGHGFATKDHSMWKLCSNFHHGCEIPYRFSCYGCCLYCCWLAGCSLTRCHYQDALSQGVFPFVFTKEYNVHPDILSTILHMIRTIELCSFPISEFITYMTEF